MVGYTFYIEEILQYMSYILMRIYKIKGIFKDIYYNNAQIRDNKVGYFNFPK